MKPCVSCSPGFGTIGNPYAHWADSARPSGSASAASPAVLSACGRVEAAEGRDGIEESPNPLPKADEKMRNPVVCRLDDVIIVQSSCLCGLVDLAPSPTRRALSLTPRTSHTLAEAPLLRGVFLTVL